MAAVSCMSLGPPWILDFYAGRDHALRSFFLYMASMRSVTAKPPKMLMLAITTAARPSHFAAGTAAASAAISAPTTITEEIALVTDISGVCSAGVTDQTT